MTVTGYIVENFILSSDAATKVVAQLDFAKASLLPAMALDHQTNQPLMQAWMNKDALHETLTTGRACYYSRSRQSLWHKGDTSGHVQHVKAVRTDCDKDSIILLVEQIGAACHTMRRYCFYHNIKQDGSLDILIDPMCDGHH